MLTLEKFEEASETVKKVAQETKLVYSDFYSAQTENKIYLKPENMQFTGAYKLRGAYYKLSTLSKRSGIRGLLRLLQAIMPRGWLMQPNAMGRRRSL